MQVRYIPADRVRRLARVRAGALAGGARAPRGARDRPAARGPRVASRRQHDVQPQAAPAPAPPPAPAPAPARRAAA